MKSLKDYLDESVLDSIKDKLSPELWSGEKMKPSAKSFIVNKLKTWLKSVSSKEPTHIFMLGSMAGFQYAPDADIDVNFVVEISAERVEELAKILPNGHNLPGTAHPINYYVSNEVKTDWKKQGPLYDILKDKWIEKPKKDRNVDTVQNYRAVSEIGRLFITAAESAIGEFNTDVSNFQAYESFMENADDTERADVERLRNNKLYEVIADIDSIFILKHIVKALRKEAFADSPIEMTVDIKMKDSNTSVNNLIYKYLERLGYFEQFDKILDQREKWEKKFSSL